MISHIDVFIFILLKLVFSILLIFIVVTFINWIKKYLYLNNLDENTTVLITGAANGIGHEITKILNSKGCSLILWDIDFETLKRSLDCLKDKSRCIIQKVDVSNSKSIRNALEVLENQHKSKLSKLSYIIASAGIVNGKKVLDLEEYEVKRTMEVNYLQYFLLFKNFYPYLQENQGNITIISSVTGLISLSSLSDYCASKFALVGFNESLRLELRKIPNNKVSTTIVLPFIVNTKMFQGIKIMFPANIFLKTLDKKDVALRIIKGMQRREEWIIIPWILRFLPILFILPGWLRNILYDLIKEHEYMKTFHK